jgi:hypothetical protein
MHGLRQPPILRHTVYRIFLEAYGYNFRFEKFVARVLCFSSSGALRAWMNKLPSCSARQLDCHATQFVFLCAAFNDGGHSGGLARKEPSRASAIAYIASQSGFDNPDFK